MSDRPEYKHEWYLKNKGRVRENKRRWRKENPEKNKECDKRNNKNYYYSHREDLLRKKREKYKQSERTRQSQGLRAFSEGVAVRPVVQPHKECNLELVSSKACQLPPSHKGFRKEKMKILNWLKEVFLGKIKCPECGKEILWNSNWAKWDACKCGYNPNYITQRRGRWYGEGK